MKLIVHELDGGIYQRLIPDKNYIVSAVRPHLIRFGRPAGSIKIQLVDDLNILIAESETVDISSIGSADYFHGYVRFNMSVGLMKDQEYRFKIIGTNGYTFSESAYIGVCNDFDLRKYPASYTDTEGPYAPLDIEVWALSPR